MKKTLFTLMLMLASVVTVNAQSLTSNAWMITDGEVVVVLSFEDDGTCGVVIAGEEVEEESGMKWTITLAAIVPGTYTLNGDKLTLKLDTEKSDINVDYEIDGVDEQTKKILDAMIKPELEKQKPEMKKEMLKELPWAAAGSFKVVSVSKMKLVLADKDGKETSFIAAPEDCSRQIKFQ